MAQLHLPNTGPCPVCSLLPAHSEKECSLLKAQCIVVSVAQVAYPEPLTVDPIEGPVEGRDNAFRCACGHEPVST